jgi:hypothetical protein
MPVVMFMSECQLLLQLQLLLVDSGRQQDFVNS